MLQKAFCSIGWSSFQGCKSVETLRQEIGSATYIARTVSGMALVPGDTEDLRSNGASRLPALN